LQNGGGGDFGPRRLLFEIEWLAHIC
jgi:hypothetical protein